MTRLKKCFSLILIFILMLSCFPVAFAANSGNLPSADILLVPDPTGPITWTVSGDVLTIRGSGKIPYIPPAYNSTSTKTAAPWGNFNIKTVNIGSGIVSIGSKSFTGMNTIETVSLPNTLKTIGDNAFSGCSKLKTITLPGSLEELGKYSFSNSGLESISFANTLVKDIDDGAFYSCKNLSTVTFTNSKVENISVDAFKNTALTNVTFSSTVKRIESKAFANTFIFDVTIPTTVVYCAEDAFNQNTVIHANDNQVSEFIPVQKIECENIRIPVNTSMQLNPTVDPDNASIKILSFSSDDEQIAKVDANGKVSALAIGTTQIAITTSYSSAVRKAITVEVYQPVRSISVGQDRIVTEVGRTVELVAAAEPANAANKNLVYVSSDESVATVDADGTVEIKGQGKAVITVISEENNTITKTIEVEGAKAEEPVKKSIFVLIFEAIFRAIFSIFRR